MYGDFPAKTKCKKVVTFVVISKRCNLLLSCEL